MLLTEKEKRIVNALLEEELNCTMDCGAAKDETIEAYSKSLTTILMKLNEKSFRTPQNKCFYFVSREVGGRQLA